MNSLISKVNGSILCSWINKDEVKKYRSDISNETEIIQVSARLLKKDTHVKAHKHFPIKKETIGTQEAWIVIDGKISAKVYDIDDSLLEEIQINSGGLIAFYRGGHELLVLDETIFYEIKTGPYYGYENDKEQIN